MSDLSSYRRVKTTLDRTLGGLLVALIAITVVNVLWQVATRFVLGSPSSVTEELARYLLIWISILGAGYSVGQRSHLALELLPEKLEGRSQRRLQQAILLFIGLFSLLVMVVGGLRLVYLQFLLGQTSSALGWPLGAVYLVVPLAGLVMLVYVIIFYFLLHREGVEALREVSTPDSSPTV